MQDINFKVEYVSNFPLEGNSPKVKIYGNHFDVFTVLFVDKKNNTIVFSGQCNTNQMIVGGRQWYTDWLIIIQNSKNEVVYQNEFDPNFKKVFIKFDAYALGDNIAWMPYVEEFRKKYNCDVICSTFHNYLFEEVYPEILFVKPNTTISNVYFQVYIGALTEQNDAYSPCISTHVPLQKVASDVLGLEYSEIRPKVGVPVAPKPNYGGRYVCISEFGSHPSKSWKLENGWQSVVNFLNSIGYRVVVISKEPSTLTNVFMKTGNISLGDRMVDLQHADLFIGVSSGLAWLSWAVGTRVMMISDVTPSWHEFQGGMTRLIKNDIPNVDYSETEPTQLQDVLEALKKIL